MDRRRFDTQTCRVLPDLDNPAQAMSSKRLDKISDYARHGYAITVQCLDCGHSAKIDARAPSDESHPPQPVAGDRGD